MKSLVAFLLLILCGTVAVAQSIPQNPNVTDSSGLRQGKWTILFDPSGSISEDTLRILGYRIIEYNNDKPVGIVRDYFKNGRVQMDGAFLADRPKEIMNGVFHWYRENGRLEAVVKYESGKPINEKYFDTNGRETRENWRSLQNKASAFREATEFEQAMAILKKAIPQAEKEFGPLHYNYVNSMKSLADIYLLVDDPPSSIPLFEKIVEVQKLATGLDSYDYAVAMSNLAEPQVYTSQFEQAEANFAKASDIMKSVFGEQSAQYSTSINNLGYLYSKTQRPEKAIEFYTRAMAISKKIGQEREPGYAFGLANLGFLDMGLGRYDDAEGRYIEAVSILREKLGVLSSDYNTILDLLAITYTASGKYQMAEPLLLDILDNTRKGVGEKHPEYFYSLDHLARLYASMGRYDKAETVYLQSVGGRKELFGEDHIQYVTGLSELGGVYMQAGQYKKAEPIVLQVLEYRKRSGENTLEYARDLIPLSAIQFRTGRRSEAIASLEKIAVIGKKEWTDTNYRHSLGMCTLATLYLSLKEYEKAEPLLEKGVNLLKEQLGENDPQYFTFLNNLATLYSYEGKPEKAEPLFVECNRKFIAKIETQFPGLSEVEKGQFISTFSNNTEIFFSFASNRARENPSILGDFYNRLLFTKSILFRSTEKIRKNILSSGDAALMAMYQTWISDRNYLTKVYQLTDDAKHKREIDEKKIEEGINRLEKQLSARSGLFASANDKSRSSWQDVQQRLKAGEAAIEMIRFNRLDASTPTVSYAALILKPESSLPELVLLDNGKELEGRHLAFYMNAINGLSEDNNSYAQYWLPISNYLHGIKKIYFSPDGVYNSMNMNTLYNSSTRKYLFDELEIQLVTNTGDLLITDKEIPSSKNAALFGYPDYLNADSTNLTVDPNDLIASARGDSIKRFFTGGNISPLPGTLTEVNQLETMLRGNGWRVSKYVGLLATEAAIKSLNDIQVLHIATHGFFIADVQEHDRAIAGVDTRKFIENPLLRSGLLMAGSQPTVNGQQRKEDNSEDGILTAYEALNLNLDHTELLILSACETGRGEIKNGEGVYGLQRAFQVAGAKTILMSLWKVNDTATQELMTVFYKNWLKTGNKREAFIKAQQKLRSKYKKPYYWGAFVMVG